MHFLKSVLIVSIFLFSSETILGQETTPDQPQVYTIIEKNPEFQEGQSALYKWLGEKIKYPEEAIKQKKEGTVYVAFIIHKDGSLSDFKVKRGIGSGCDEEALRVVKLMPNWKPGTQQNRPVNTNSTLPIKFKL